MESVTELRVWNRGRLRRPLKRAIRVGGEVLGQHSSDKAVARRAQA